MLSFMFKGRGWEAGEGRKRGGGGGVGLLLHGLVYVMMFMSSFTVRTCGLSGYIAWHFIK